MGPLSRRSLLRTLALGGVAAGALGVKAPAKPRLLVVLARGGWDVTYGPDPKGPDLVEGPWVDVDPDNPEDVESIERFAGVPFAVNPYQRPKALRFVERWAPKLTWVNGIDIGAISHNTGVVRILTGTNDPLAPDLAVLAGLATTAPIAAVDLSGSGRVGEHGPAAMRVGIQGQIVDLLTPKERNDTPDGPRPRWAPSAEDQAELDAWLDDRVARDRDLRGASDAEVRKLLDDLAEARRRGLQLRDQGAGRLAPPEPGEEDGFQALAQSALDLLDEGLVGAALVDSGGRWDSHYDGFRQQRNWDDLLGHLDDLLTNLDQHDRLRDTLVVVVSEMGRSPYRNFRGGTDHWPSTSALVVGAGLPGGRVLGGTDDGLLPLPVDLGTGAIDPAGTVVNYTAFVNGVLALLDAEPVDDTPPLVVG